MSVEFHQSSSSQEPDEQRVARPRLAPIQLPTDPGELIAQLETAITAAPRLPLTSTLLIDGDACLYTIDELKALIPGAIRLARQVLNRPKELLSEARQQAGDLLRRADEERRWVLDQETIDRSAQVEARRIMERAERRAEALREESNAYAERIYAALHERLREFDRAVDEALNLFDSGEVGLEDPPRGS